MPRDRSGIQSSNDTLDQASAVASVGTEPAPAAPPAASAAESSAEKQPNEYPIDFDEWQVGMSGMYRTHIAGYREETRVAGQLTAKKMRRAWDHGFKVFLGEAEPEDAPRD